MEGCSRGDSSFASRWAFLMNNYTHQTAPTQFVEVAGIRFAYRRFASRRFGAKIDTALLFVPRSGLPMFGDVFTK